MKMERTGADCGGGKFAMSVKSLAVYRKFTTSLAAQKVRHYIAVCRKLTNGRMNAVFRKHVADRISETEHCGLPQTMKRTLNIAGNRRRRNEQILRATASRLPNKKKTEGLSLLRACIFCLMLLVEKNEEKKRKSLF